MRSPRPGPDREPDTQATQATQATHATHERGLIAARAAGDLIGPELADADALLERCRACRALHDDLLAIAAATRALPAPARSTELDYRISADRASRLRRGAFWRRLLRPFGRQGSPTVRPLAAAFTTLGLAGLMLVALPSLQLGSGAAAPLAAIGSEVPRDAQGLTASPEIAQPDTMASPGATGRAAAGGEGTIDTSNGYGPAPTADDQGVGPTAAPNAGGTSTDGDLAGEKTGEPTTPAGVSSGSTPLLALSVGFLGLGLGLFVIRKVALRIR